MHLAVLLAASLVAPAVPLHARGVLVVNTGNDAIFTLRVGLSAQQRWSDDLLGIDRVIDVGRGSTIEVPVNRARCRADVQATFHGGATVVVRNVNLCAVTRIDIGNE